MGVADRATECGSVSVCIFVLQVRLYSVSTILKWTFFWGRYCDCVESEKGPRISLQNPEIKQNDLHHAYCTTCICSKTKNKILISIFEKKVNKNIVSFVIICRIIYQSLKWVQELSQSSNYNCLRSNFWWLMQGQTRAFDKMRRQQKLTPPLSVWFGGYCRCRSEENNKLI